MARRREVPKRRILPDPKFGDRTVAKFTNAVMIGGKKSVAERAVYDAIKAATRRDVVARLGAGGNVLEALEALPGVGHKTAGVVMSST